MGRDLCESLLDELPWPRPWVDLASQSDFPCLNGSNAGQRVRKLVLSVAGNPCQSQNFSAADFKG